MLRIYILVVLILMMVFDAVCFAVPNNIPPELPVKLFAQLPNAMQVHISPDGRHIAWVSALAEGRKHAVIKRIDGKNQKLMAIPPTNDADINWIRWANNKRLLISYKFDIKRRNYRSRTLETRLLSFSADGKDMVNMTEPKKLTKGASKLQRAYAHAQIQDSIIDMLPDDPDHILIALNEDQNFSSGFVVRKVNVNTGKYKLVAQEGWVVDWKTDQSHIPRLAIAYKLFGDVQKKVISYRNLETNEWEEISDSPLYTRYAFVEFFDNPRYAYVTGVINNHKSLLKFDMHNQNLVEVIFSHEQHDIDNILWHPVTGKLAGISYIADSQVNIYFDEDMARRQKVLDTYLKGFDNRIVSSTADGSKHIVFSNNATDPGVFYLYDETGKRLDEIAEYYKGINPAHMATVEEISYEARDGFKIYAYLTLPKGRERKKLPSVILPHGGPWARDYKTFHYIAQLLANRGYAVLQPNFRGSTGYGYSFKRAGERQWGLTMQDDITDGTQWMISQGVADPERICIAGLSYGGYAALMAAVKTPDLYKCSASINGISDLLELIREDKRMIGSGDWISMIGNDKKSLKEVSPARHASKIKIPVLIVQAKDDMRVHLDQAEDMADALEDHDKDVELLILENGGHDLDVEGSRFKMLKTLEAFLSKYLNS